MTAKVGRNDPCPCGSGKKYKKCCLLSAAPTAAAIERLLPAELRAHELRMRRRRQTPGLHRTPGDQMLRTVCQWSNVFDGPLPPLLSLVRQIRRFNVGNVLDILSRMSCFYFYKQSKGSMLRIPRGCFPDLVQPRLDELMSQNLEPVVSRATLLYLEQIALRFGDTKNRNILRDEMTAVGPMLLLGAEYAEQTVTVKLAALKDKPDSCKAHMAFGAYFFSNLLLNHFPIIGPKLSRYWFFFMHYPAELGLTFDVRQTVTDSTGVDPQVYIGTAFAMLGHYLKGDDEAMGALFASAGTFTIPTSYFQSIDPAVRPSAERAMELLSGEMNWFREQLRTNKAPASGFSSKPIFERPMAKLAGLSVPLDIGFLTDQASFGLYYLVNDKLRATDRKKQKLFSDAWGKIVEHHARRLIESALGASRGKRYFTEDDQRTKDGCRADFILRDGDDLAFIEVTKSHVPPPRAMSADWRQIKPSLDLVLFRSADGKRGKALQLMNAIADFKSGKLRLDGVEASEIKRIFPVLVLEHGIAQVPPAITLIRKKIARKSGLADEASRFEFLDLEELEMATPFLQAGITSLLTEKISAGYGEFPLKNYLAHKSREAEVSEYMGGLFATAGKEMGDFIFGRDKK